MAPGLDEIVAKIEEFRDDPTPEAVQEAAKVLTESWTQPSDAIVVKANASLAKLAGFPETQNMALGGMPLALLALARAAVADNPAEVDSLCACIGNVYRNQAKLRAGLRLALGSALSPSSSVSLLRVALTVVRSVLAAGAHAETEACKALLLQRLLPLHLVQGKISPTESLLGQFHRELTLCVGEVTKSSAELLDTALLSVLEKYPGLTEGNSPKEVLFLHELEFLLQRADKLSPKARQAAVVRLASCAGSLHSLVAERALSFWQSPGIIAKLQGDDGLLDRSCSLLLAKTSSEHWSATVRSMAGAALVATTTKPAKRDAVVEAAIAAAKAPPPPAPQVEPAPIPTSFSSTSVIRDATEPFAHGAFGSVWRGRATVPGKPKAQWPLLALKEMQDKSLAAREVEVMSRIGPHPNIVALLGVFDGKISTSIVLELCEGGDLHSAVVERGSLSMDVTRHLAGEVGNGLRHVHAKGFVFGDVKPENIVLTKDGHAKLCDFGSCFDRASAGPIKGTVEYLAPEQVASVEGDWWAFGCVIHFMLTGRPPVFFHSDEADLQTAFSRAVSFAREDGGALITDAQARQLVGLLTSRDPTKRPKDGGESHHFFDAVRPWATLSQRPAPVLAVGAAPRDKGPWTRRTFSVMHSPMPAKYEAGIAGFKVTGTEGSGATWVGGGEALPLDSIPKKRVLVPAASAGGLRPRPVAGAGPASSYNVLGLDLTAG